MNNTETGFVLLRIDYDPATHDLVGITSRFEGGQGCCRLTVQQVDTPDQTQGDCPFIAY